jgi:hypothetical protein
MWFVGYLVFAIGLATATRWSSRQSGKWKARAWVTGVALPVAWGGILLAIPFSRTRHFSTSTLLPDLGIAAYMVAVGLLCGWFLERFPRLGLATHLVVFVLLHALSILVGGALVVGLSGS